MKRYWTAVGLLLAGLLLIFLIGAPYIEPRLEDMAQWIKRGGAPAAALGAGLLVADILLPVPSSLVMIAHGAVFGIWTGTLLSLVGSLGAGLAGFAIGRAGGPLLDRVVKPEEKKRADALLAKWGILALIATRPVPLLAETVSIVAGASSLKTLPAALAILAGNVPAALIYALTGAAAVNIGNTALVFGLVLFIAGIAWLIGKRFANR